MRPSPSSRRRSCRTSPRSTTPSCSPRRRSNATTIRINNNNSNNGGGHLRDNLERARATKVRKERASSRSGHNQHGRQHGNDHHSPPCLPRSPSQQSLHNHSHSGRPSIRQPGTCSHKPFKAHRSHTISPPKASQARTPKATRAAAGARARTRDSTAQGQTLEPTRQVHNPHQTTLPPRRRGRNTHVRPKTFPPRRRGRNNPSG